MWSVGWSLIVNNIFIIIFPFAINHGILTKSKWEIYHVWSETWISIVTTAIFYMFHSRRIYFVSIFPLNYCYSFEGAITFRCNLILGFFSKEKQISLHVRIHVMRDIVLELNWNANSFNSNPVILTLIPSSESSCRYMIQTAFFNFFFGTQLSVKRKCCRTLNCSTKLCWFWTK